MQRGKTRKHPLRPHKAGRGDGLNSQSERAWQSVLGSYNAQSYLEGLHQATHGSQPMSGKAANSITQDLGVLVLTGILLAIRSIAPWGWGLRRFHWRPLRYLMLFMTYAWVVGASEDENVRRAFSARIAVENQQPNAAHDMNWQWVSQHMGLRTPAENNPYDGVINRPDSNPMPVPTYQNIQVIYQRDPMSYLSAIERIWTDLGATRDEEGLGR